VPIELRQIMLSEKEVLQAIHVYRRARTDFLPHGDGVAFSLKPTAGDSLVHMTIQVDMIYGQTRQTISIETAEADVVDMLVRCCLENNIPIPKAGRKSASVVDGMLTLTIYSDDDSANVAAPCVRRHAMSA